MLAQKPAPAQSSDGNLRHSSKVLPTPGDVRGVQPVGGRQRLRRNRRLRLRVLRRLPHLRPPLLLPLLTQACNKAQPGRFVLKY